MTKEEAIKRIKDWNLDNDKIEVLSVIIPELKESEDERIKSELISLFKDGIKGISHRYTGEDCERWIAWLEKQGEQKPLHNKKHIDYIKGIRKELLNIEDSVKNVKGLTESQWVAIRAAHRLLGEYLEKQSEQKPTDNVEPKFKVGDWIINSEGKIRHIIGVDESGYLTDYGWLTHDSYEREFHLWNIEDAKDGDILANDGGSICIFDGTVEEGIYPFAYCGLTNNGFEIYDRKLPFTHDRDIHPATKEQRDLLFQKMKEVDYQYDAEKKELKKIETIDIPFGAKDSELMGATYYIPEGFHAEIKNNKVIIEKGEQKTTWSEEDERLQQCLIEDQEKCLEEVENNKVGHTEIISDLKEMYRERIDWLKSLKERIQSQPKWSEEDEERYVSCLQRLGTGNLKQPETINTVWLKSLKERVQLV